MSDEQDPAQERQAAINLMFAREATVLDVVTQFPDLTLSELNERAAMMNDPFGTFMSERSSDSFQYLVRTTVQAWINDLYRKAPSVAERLDRELNPGI